MNVEAREAKKEQKQNHWKGTKKWLREVKPELLEKYRLTNMKIPYASKSFPTFFENYYEKNHMQNGSIVKELMNWVGKQEWRWKYEGIRTS